MSAPFSLKTTKTLNWQSISGAFSFRLQWLLLTGLSWAAGIWANGLILPQLYKILGLNAVEFQAFSGIVISLIQGGLIGAYIGMAQWVVIRKSIRRSGTWIWTNCLSWAVAYAIGIWAFSKITRLSPHTIEINTVAYEVTLVMIGLVAGIGLSLLQWPVVKDHFSDPKTFFLSTIMSWPIAMTIYAVLMYLILAVQVPLGFISSTCNECLHRAMLLNLTSKSLLSCIGFFAALIHSHVIDRIHNEWNASLRGNGIVED